MDKKIRRIFSAETKALDDSRSLIVTISTDSPDRDGDVVVPKGGKLDNFLKNPVVLFGHKYNEPPIAKAEELVVDEHGIKAKVTFPEEGVYAFADAIYGLIKAGIMHAWSIGFQASGDATEQLPGGGLKFNSWELLEFSAVPVPANPEALTILRSKGLTDDEIKEMTVEDSKVDEADDHDDHDDHDHHDQKMIVAITYNDDRSTVTLTANDGVSLTYALDAELQKDLQPPAPETDPEALAKALTTLRDQLKPADKEIGLALRTLKTLLAKPTN